MIETQLRSNLIRKINNLKQDETLELTDREVKYCIERWIKGNYNNFNFSEIKFFHYIDPEDPENNRELIGAKILRSE
jgi:hypothetical protein